MLRATLDVPALQQEIANHPMERNRPNENSLYVTRENYEVRRVRRAIKNHFVRFYYILVFWVRILVGCGVRATNCHCPLEGQTLAAKSLYLPLLSVFYLRQWRVIS